MGFFDKIFGKKEKESLDQGLQKTKEGFLSKITKLSQVNLPLMKRCSMTSKMHL